MTYNPDIHHRRSIRLAGYDYSSDGFYFITICAHHRAHLFGEIVPTANMTLNQFGAMVEFTWFDLLNHVANIQLHEFMIMPNHVHGIIHIVSSLASPGKRTVFKPAPLAKPGKPQPLAEIVRQFKTFSAKRINALRKTPGMPVWQRNYYEHIIRNDESYRLIAEYILNNPLTWQQDMLYGEHH